MAPSDSGIVLEPPSLKYYSLFVSFVINSNVTTSSIGWTILAFGLFFSSFGLAAGFCILFYLAAFFAGILAALYYHGRSKTQEWIRASSHLTFPPPSVGISKLVADVRKGKPAFRTDKRMTGSTIIDEVLQEILEFTYRDYIHSWYKRISDDRQFRHDIRQTLQRVVIAFSERSKQVDLVPYCTRRLVDDFASHIRLYRRAVERVKEHKKDDTKPPPDLESIFFDLETEMEKNLCRDIICMSEEREREYLQDLCEVLLFLLLPPDDFHNKPFRYIVREVLVNGILLPTMNLISDPDYINQTLCWLCKDYNFTNETFLTVLKTSDCIDELNAIKEKVDVDIARQRSKDTGGDDDTLIKQQLSSLHFVKDLCEERSRRLLDGSEEIDPHGIDIQKYMVPGQRLYSLPFDVVLNNNVALSYFIEFMTNINCQHYLFFYLTIEGYRVSAEQQISAALLADKLTERPDLEMLRDAALSIYNQYLSEKASPRLHLDEELVRNVLYNIQSATPSDTIFDEVQARVWDLLQEEQFFPTFKRSQLYIRLLAELDLLKEQSKAEELLNNGDTDDGMSGSSKSSSLQASIEDLASSCDSLSSADTKLGPTKPNSYTLNAEITNTGICREHGKAYAVYLITITRTNSDGSVDSWDVCRRYSDFHDLHMTLQERYESLSGLVLPGKRTFNNMNKDFLEKRKAGLNAYLQSLLNPAMLNSHKGLLEIIFQFIEHMVWEKEKSQLARKMDTFVNPLKNSVRNVSNMVKSMPDNFADGVAKMSGGIKSIPSNMLDSVGKVLNVKGPPALLGLTLMNMLKNDELKKLDEYLALKKPPTGMAPNIKAEMLDSAKVGASLENEDDQENIPLRIMLLLMDEVFELKNRNQWMRRRIVGILRQIVKVILGDSMNRKIVDHVEWLTSEEQVAESLKMFRDSFWPNGIPSEPRPQRDLNTKMRTRIVSKCKMFGSISDELRHVIGSETTRQGVMRVFNMFQHQTLNRRLVYVILEGLLETLFPDNKFLEVFRKLHSRSPRVKSDQLSAGDIHSTSKRKKNK